MSALSDRHGDVSMLPCGFGAGGAAGSDSVYLRDPAVRKLVEFFRTKGLAALKREDREEVWYADWIAYQAEHRIYASVLSPGKYSSLGFRFDLLKLARMYEVFAYFSPAHGYSLQVSLLGLFPILMGDNEALKRDAIALLEKGGLFALGVSEEAHGSDLLSNEFEAKPAGENRFVANGTKFYIGNANAAAIISVLAKQGDAKSRRSPLMLFALRGTRKDALARVRKIRTLGIRSAYVGEFEVKGYEFPEADVIARGRRAWDAVFGTITVGKFFLGFGSIGICERAFEETWRHVSKRVLFGKPVTAMPHIRRAMARAYARLLAMKLYAYRALDYFQAAHAEDRRYLLFSAVQKAKTSTEGVRVLELLTECAGAKGFDSDTYLESARRDIQLIPALEGSTHINFALVTQFTKAYFDGQGSALADQKSLVAARLNSPKSGEAPAAENEYLTQARAEEVKSIAFPDFLKAYAPLTHIANVRRFTRQAKALRRFLTALDLDPRLLENTQVTIALGKCVATVAFAQLVAEHAMGCGVPREAISLLFDGLIEDLSIASLLLASESLSTTQRALLRKVIVRPRIKLTDVDFVLNLADTNPR